MYNIQLNTLVYREVVANTYIWILQIYIITLRGGNLGVLWSNWKVLAFVLVPVIRLLSKLSAFLIPERAKIFFFCSEIFWRISEPNQVLYSMAYDLSFTVGSGREIGHLLCLATMVRTSGDIFQSPPYTFMRCSDNFISLTFLKT